MAEEKEKKTCGECGWFSINEEKATHGVCMKTVGQGWHGSGHVLKPTTPACNAFEKPKYR